jgi:ATP-dependent protease ClpP protease subunit
MAKTILIDGEIGKAEGQVSAQWFQSQMPVNSSEPIEIVIHSEGGNVWEGFKIYDLLTAYSGRKKAVIRSTAFSIASFIPMACDEIEIAPKAEFVLKCLEKEMPMSQVATEAATEAMTEMESLLARLAATEEENMQLKAQLAAKEEAPVPTAPVQEPTAKRTGAAPVAKASGNVLTAKAKWSSAVQAKIQAGMKRDQALLAVDREAPELRAQMLAEVNPA